MAQEWTKVEVDLNQLLGPINDVIQTIDSVLVVLITILNIVSAILEVIKVFLVGLLDPIRTLVELIISEIRKLIQDLRQLGLYINGDWNLLKADGGFANIIGGYPAYERRMVARLLDRSDPGRPDFSSASAALGVFLYVNSGDIDEIIRAVRAIMNFFGRGSLMGRSKGYSTPTSPEIAVGSDPTGLALFSSISKAAEAARSGEDAGSNALKAAGSAVADPPKYVSLTWSMPPGIAGKSFKTPSPKGFLIHCSTVKDGLGAVALIPNSEKSADPNNPDLVVSVVADPITGTPLRLYGGASDLAVASTATDYSSVENPDPNSPRLFLTLGQNSPYMPASLILNAERDRPAYGRTFYCKNPPFGPAKIGGGTTFTAVIDKDELPVHATFTQIGPNPGDVEITTEDTTEYFFRVRALSKEYADLFSEGTLVAPKAVDQTNIRLFHVSKQSLIADPSGLPILPETTGDPANISVEVTFNSISNASGPSSGQVPSDSAFGWVNLVQKALAVVILTRPDLVEAEVDAVTGEVLFEDGTYPPGGDLGIEGGGRELLGRYGINKTLYKTRSPVSFRNKVNRILAKVSNQLSNKQPPPDVVIEALGADASVAALTNWRWADGAGAPSEGGAPYPEYSILSSFRQDDSSAGVGANPFSRGDQTTKKALELEYFLVDDPESTQAPQRAPGFSYDGEDPAWIAGDGSADYSPIIYDNASGTVEFCRNVLINQDRANPDQSVLAGTAKVLQVAAATRTIGDASWIAIRLLPQALTPLEDILKKIDKIMTGILDGLQGAIDFIVQYIEAIQARIKQLQAFIEAIRALLRALQFFAIPSVAGLVFVENGTSGLVSGLLSSENKPTSDSGDYGAGIVVVAGGLPTVLLEILQLLFVSTDEEA